MNEQSQTPPKPKPKIFNTIDGNTLMSQHYDPLQFCIEKILPHGIFVFAGSPKVGKSWLTLDMCQSISTGGKLWDFNTTQGEVLYLALEDKFSRLLWFCFFRWQYSGYRSLIASQKKGAKLQLNSSWGADRCAFPSIVQPLHKLKASRVRRTECPVCQPEYRTSCFIHLSLKSNSSSMCSLVSLQSPSV